MQHPPVPPRRPLEVHQRLDHLGEERLAPQLAVGVVDGDSRDEAGQRRWKVLQQRVLHLQGSGRKGGVWIYGHRATDEGQLEATLRLHRVVTHTPPTTPQSPIGLPWRSRRAAA